MFKNLMQKIVKWLDPKLEPYRKPKPKYAPQTLQEFIEILKRTPRNILDDKSRNRIAAVMSFDERHVSDLMVTKEQIPFVDSQEVLGPLMLDKLYKSGFTHFPVVNDQHKIIGIIHTEALNTLANKKTDCASKYLDPVVHYLHMNDSLQFVVEEIERTGSYYFLVLNSSDQPIGCLTVQMILDYFLD